MGRVDDELTPQIAEIVRAQHVFFVATAPSGSDGHVNVSPKGLDTFAVLSPREVAYLDLTGSGAETMAHLLDNGRITVMFCTFEGPPMIVRIYGHGEVIPFEAPRAAELLAHFPSHPGARAIIRVDVTRVSTSCGYAVPEMSFVGARTRLDEWSVSQGPDGLAAYRDEKNAESIDGLPAWSALPH